MIVGCGRVAGGYNRGPDDAFVLTHALAYRRHPRFDLVACVEPDDALRAQFMKTWNVPAGFATLEAALEGGAACDVVSVCSPTPTHVATLERLLHAPARAVFAEKPLGGDPARIAPLVSAYRAAGRALAVAFPRRWDDEVMALRAEIRSGDWGPLRTGVCLYGRGVVNNGSHHVDLLDMLFGETITVLAVTAARDDGVAGDPTIDAVLELGGGARIHLAGTDGRDHSLFELTLVFARGVVTLEQNGLTIRRRRAGMSPVFAGIRMAGEGEAKATGYGRAFLAALDDIERVLACGGEPLSNGDTALRAISLCADLSRRAAAPARSN